MISVYNLQKAQKTAEDAKMRITFVMPNSKFQLIGIDNQSIYFNVTVYVSQTTSKQIKNLMDRVQYVLVDDPMVNEKKMVYKFFMDYNNPEEIIDPSTGTYNSKTIARINALKGTW